ncbi:MAG TPA: hypothetical protein VMH34_07535 [Gammaproteobacteria bacterium]|nr:hypothetical protein [Gammaproteobacteria bacterium]
MEFGRLEVAGIGADGVAVDWRAGADDQSTLHATAHALNLPSGVTLNEVDVTCSALAWDAANIRCDRGDIEIGGANAAKIKAPVHFVYDMEHGRLALDVNQAEFAKGTVSATLTRTPSDWQADIHGAQLTVPELRKWMQKLGVWPGGYTDEAGKVTFHLTAAGNASSWTHARIDLNASDFSVTGKHLADHAAFHIEAAAEQSAQAGIGLQGRAELTAGAIYVESGMTVQDYHPGATLEVADGPITATWDADYAPDGKTLQMRRFSLNQPGVLKLAASGDLAPAAPASVRRLVLTVDDVDMRAAYEQHVKPMCSHIESLCGLEAEGHLSGEMTWESDGVHDLHARFRGVYLDDARRRFRLSNLDGDLLLNDGSTPMASALRWDSASLYRLNFGGGRVAMSSKNRQLAITEWSDVRILGGTLKLDQFEIARVGHPDFSFKTRGRLSPISMQDFCQAMGWPVFSGQLSGVLPEMTYEHDNLFVHGDLLMNLFGGVVVIHDLRVASLFGDTPVLTTDVAIANIDLEQLTSAFSFGKIEGKLEGGFKDLRLENWSPVYFEARFQTPRDDHSRHRISQRAVDNLSAIGSGGVTSSLSRGFLQVFKDYSYDQLGIACRLYHDVCEMDGVAPAPDGFYIVTRGGLMPPWIDVKGTGHAIPWSDLVYGLKRIASGDMQVQ